MEVEKYDALRMDFQTLMSCIHYHGDSQDKDVVLETLKTIIDICTNESCGRDAFREEGGLDFLVEFLIVTDNTVFLEHVLKTLAFVIDENVHNQIFMSKRSVFEVLQAILKNHSFPTTVQKNALALISTVLYQNSTAQNLIFEIGLLQDLLNLYEHCSQSFMINNSCMTSNLDNFALNLWTSINSALCFAVNNPQNEKNQDLCKNIFPVSLKILEFSSNSAIMSSAASFLSLTMSENGKCQDYFSYCDGFLVLKRCFQKNFDALLFDVKVCNGITGKDTYQAISNIVGIVTSASLDHEKNAAISGDLDILSMMVKLLFMEILQTQLKTKIVLCLGHCIGACCTNKTHILETENFDTFLKKCLQLGTAELSSACKYLLQVCLAPEGSSESNLHCIGNSSFASISSKYNDNYFNGAIQGSLVSNRLDAKSPSLKQSSTKELRIRSPGSKLKNNSRFVDKTYSSSSSHENTIQKVRRRKKIAKVSRSINKLSSIRKALSNPSTIQYDNLSDNKFSGSIFSETNLNSPKFKFYKNPRTQLSSHDEFSKQNKTSNKMPFTDFLKNEAKSDSLNYRNINFPETDCAKSVSASLISESNKYYKTTQSHNKKSSEKIGSISQNNICNPFLACKKELSNQSSVVQSPKLFKRKKERIYSKQSSNSSSITSSEYYFTPYNIESSKSQEKDDDARFGFCVPYQSTKNLEEKNNQESWMKRNSTYKKQALGRKPFSFTTQGENHIKKDQKSDFPFTFSPVTFKKNLAQDSSVSQSQEKPNIGKENLLDLKTFPNSSHQHGTSLMDSGFSSNIDSYCSKNPDICLDNSYQCTNWAVLPNASRILKNPYEKKYSLNCSSIDTDKYSFSPFDSPLNSSCNVQVIVLPKKTCEQHDLSASSELLEVISLEDIIEG